jgi:hypothetical protein
MGMVIRDPWYDFNTNPAYPGQPNYTFQDRMGAMLELAGVRWVRLDFHIAVPLAGVNVDQTAVISAEISKNDYFITQVAPRHKLKVLGLLTFDLLQGTDAHLLDTGPFTETSKFGGGVNKYMHAWLTRALMIADHYRESIAAYEILNEQNRLPQYPPNPRAGDGITPQITARLLTKFYRFCKNIDPPNENHGCGPETSIILGGLHPRGTGNGTNPNLIVKTDAQYLRETYAVTDTNSPFVTFKNTYGRGYPLDGVGYHPYPEEIAPSIADARINGRLPLIRQTLIDVGDPDKPLWITEVGYNVGFVKVRGPLAEVGQADFMRDVYTSLAARGDIANVFWFKYEDFPPADVVYSNGKPVADPQRWGIVRIPFTEGGSVNGAACPGGACYDVNGTPAAYRQSFWVYRELAGLPVYRLFGPLIGR